MGSSFGKIFKISSWGESHGKAIGVVIDGCPSKIPLNENDIQKELDKRKPGQSSISTPRKENDRVYILSGVFNGYTTGSPISMIIWNKDSRSEDYENIKDVFRPGHSDYTYFMKYGIRDYRGGGRSSGRETAMRVASGAVAKKILKNLGITIHCYTQSIGNISISKIFPEEIYKNPVRSPDPQVVSQMENLILKVKKEKNSIGGVVGLISEGIPVGLGDPVFDKLDADIAKALMSIGGVKAIEIGDGFFYQKMTGKESNDPFIGYKNHVKTKTNHCGGILGGISTGMPIVVRVTVKATSSLSINQNSVTTDKKPVVIKTTGRHDPCIVPRVVPVVEAMFALVLCDHYLRNKLYY